ncbi:glycoside hydrolase family 3 protein [bacterium]|nr:glycoside hydrolase family 3 protein [bacterium]
MILLVIGGFFLLLNTFITEERIFENDNSSITKTLFCLVKRNSYTEDGEYNEDFAQKLGQNLIVGIPSSILDRKTKEILHYIKPAGIVLYRRNYKSNSQFKELINQLQQISNKDTGTPYFIMLDEEPGGATRLDLFINVFSLGLPDWKTIERDIGVLADIGINVDLAPLADFPFNSNTFVKRRIQTKNIKDLIAFNRTFIDLLCESNISATLKHFPGMGIFTDDPHVKIPQLDISQRILTESLRIFKDGINHGANFIMTGHAVYENIDPKNPATLSSIIVKDLLRDKIGFCGMIITDDLSDMALVNRKINLADVGIGALQAGHNLIIFSHKLEKIKKVFDEILAKIKTDRELQILITENYRKITDFKRKKLSN